MSDTNLGSREVRTLFRSQSRSVGVDQRFNLRDVEHRMDEPEFVRKSKMDGVVANTVDDLERSEVRFD